MIRELDNESTPPNEGGAPRLLSEPQAPCRRSSNLTSSLSRTTATLPIGPASQRILEAFRSVGSCPSHVVPLVVDSRDSRSAGAIEARCRRLTCPVCIASRRGIWLIHFIEHFSATIANGQTLFATRIDSNEWQAIKRLIQRQKGAFARVQTSNGIVVITTVNVKDALPVDYVLAVETIAEALEDLTAISGRKGKPISASTAWRLCERQGSPYRRVGFAERGRFRDTMRLVAESGMSPRVTDTGSDKFGDWRFDPNWSAQQRAEFFERAKAAQSRRGKHPASAAG